DSRKRRTNARNSALTFKRFHQRRLFANFISTGTAVPVDIEVASAAEDVLSKKSPGVGVTNRLLHNDRQVSIFSADVNVAATRAHSEPGNDHAFDHRMGVVLENQAVFAGSGFALVTIAEDILGFR